MTPPVAPSNPSQHPVTVLVFKDHLVARTFRVSLGWITRLGVLLSLIVAISLLSFFFALKYYNAARSADPIRVRALEQQLSELQDAQKEAQKAAAVTAMTVPSPVATTVPVTSGPNATAQPIPTVTVTVAPTASAPLVTAPLVTVPLTGNGYLFTALAPTTAKAEKSAIGVVQPRLSWSGHTLRVHFNIQYLSDDKASQQGRILMIARGPDMVLGYPTGVFRAATTPTLLSPESGEYFSVSRIRETKAEFNAGNSELKEVEIILLSLDGRILVHERLEAPPLPKAKPRPAAVPSAPAPAASSPAPAAPGATGLAPPMEGAAP